MCSIVFLRFWKPATIWRFAEDEISEKHGQTAYSAGRILYAWAPFILVTAFMFVWSTKAFKAFSAGLGLTIKIPGGWPGLNGVVYKVAPIVKAPEIYKAVFAFDMFAAIGTALLLVSIITTILFRMKGSTFTRVFGATFKQLRYALITIICVLGIAHLSNYAGISFTLGLAFAATGVLFMIFSPIIGFLGVFLTGSVTTSSALFGNLQRVTAMQLALNPLITVTASMVGAVMGKLISPQSIAIATAATGLVGREGEILSKTTKYALILLGIGIVVMLILTYLMPWYFPLVK